MILLIGIGFGVKHFAELPEAPWVGALLGLVVAQFIPSKNACGVRFDRGSDARDAS